MLEIEDLGLQPLAGFAEPQRARRELSESEVVSSLVRVLRPAGRRGEARILLAPVCGGFTEGFDTPDLKEAKRLLRELT